MPATTFMWHPMANLTLMATPYTTAPFDIDSAPQVARKYVPPYHFIRRQLRGNIISASIV